MKRDVSALAGSHFDLVIIGGGIFGACAAWDAVQRGLSVALIERDDFGGATSANSYKMVHGGIRYIQHGDVYRVRQSSHERKTLLRIAPHLVRPLPIVIPTYGHGMRGRQVLRAGMAMYDLLTADRNRGIKDPERRIPWGRSLGRHDVLKLFPDLEPDGLTGGAVFSDGQMYNPPRLVLAFLQRAVEGGAVVANYVEAVGFLQEGDRVCGVLARDGHSGAGIEIRGKVVLNAAGPYAEQLLQSAANIRLSSPGTYSRDACFVVSRRLFEHEYALAVQGKTRDPEAVLSRGERHLFVVPWRGYTLIGVWHVVYQGEFETLDVRDAELERFIEEINAAYPTLQITLEDVSLWNAGLVPFGENAAGAVDLRYGHRSRLIDHSATHGLHNLITLIGVRFTTGRYEAERALNLVFHKLGHRSPRSRTASTAVWGGEIPEWGPFVGEAVRKLKGNLDADIVRSLAHNYGSEYEGVIRLMEAEPHLAARIGTTQTVAAQVAYAVRSEMAQTVADVVFRRTDLGTGEYPGRSAIAECGAILGSELSLEQSTVDRQIGDVLARYPPRVVDRIDSALGTPSAKPD